MPISELRNILYLSAEIVPYARTGGLAEVAGALPRALRRLGADVRVIIPRYGLIDPPAQGMHKIAEGIPVPFAQGTEHIALWQAPDEDLPIYLIEHEGFFGNRQGIYSFPDDDKRFLFYSRASLEAARHLQWQPHVVHSNEWQTAIVANWLRTTLADDPFFRRTASVYTIHNLAYQGIFGHRVLEIAGLASQGFIAHPDLSPSLNQVVSLMGRGIIFADIITTVSPTYAREILTPTYGEGLDPILRDRQQRLVGILNGIDTDFYNPATDPHLAANFDVSDMDGRAICKAALRQEMGLPQQPHTPIISLSSRLNDQKGYNILLPILETMLQQLDAQWVIMGTGEQHYHDQLSQLQNRYPQRLAVRFTYADDLRRRIMAGSDIFLMPSQHEPCGLDQLMAMRYGAVPIVHDTGGLHDTIIDHAPPTTGTGLHFRPHNSMALYASIVRGITLYQEKTVWPHIQRQAMQYDVSWNGPAQQYLAVYQRAYTLKNTGHEPASS